MEPESTKRYPKYPHFLNAIVFCKWIDITEYEVKNIDAFLEHNQDAYYRHSLVFITVGKLVAEDEKVIVLVSTLAEKNSTLKERPAQNVHNIPKNCILNIRELEFKPKKPVKVAK